MAKKAAKGSGSIRKKSVISGGRTYHYWEARLTTGHDPATGRKVQRSITGKTQREVRTPRPPAAARWQAGWMNGWTVFCAARSPPRAVFTRTTSKTTSSPP